MIRQTYVIFREEQRFRQLWIWLLVISSAVLVVGIFGYGMVQQLIFHKPWGNQPMSDTVLIIFAGGCFLFSGALVWLFCVAKLVTEVRNDGLYIRFYPFHLSFRKIPLENVVRFEAQTYKPILDYGGWGVRWTWKGKAYNVSGNRGVRLDFKNGKRLLIGSRRPEELAGAIGSIYPRQR
jgi:hypothetical protein